MPPTPAGPMVANRLALLPVGGGHARAGDAMPREIVLHEADEGNVALVADRIEGHQPRQQLLGGDELALILVLQFTLRLVCGLSSEKAGTATSISCPPSVVIW